MTRWLLASGTRDVLNLNWMFVPRSTWGVTFLLLVVSELVLVLAFEGYVFGTFETNIRGHPSSESQLRAIPTYLALFIFAMLMQLVLAWDALRLKSTIQIVGLVLYNLAMLIYSAIQIDQIREALDTMMQEGQAKQPIFPAIEPFLITIPCVITLAMVSMIFVAFRLYPEFGWTIYKYIGADLKMKRRYMTFQIFITLLKFDFLFFLGFTIQFIVIILNKQDVEFALTIAVIPLTICLLFLVAWSVRRENYVGMIVSIIFFIAGLAYFLFKLVRMYQPGQADKYASGRRSLTAFAVMAVVLIVVTVVNAMVCTHNFKMGLKQVASPKKSYSNGLDEMEHFEINPHLLPTPSSRMLID